MVITSYKLLRNVRDCFHFISCDVIKQTKRRFCICRFCRCFGVTSVYKLNTNKRTHIGHSSESSRVPLRKIKWYLDSWWSVPYIINRMRRQKEINIWKIERNQFIGSCVHLTALCSYVIMFRSRVSTPNKREYCDFINSNSHLDFIINLLNKFLQWRWWWYKRWLGSFTGIGYIYAACIVINVQELPRPIRKQLTSSRRWLSLPTKPEAI